MKPINILYISISGNTQSFVDDLIDYADAQHDLNPNDPLIHAKEITDQTPPASESEPFVAFVPTYLDGGNGIDNGVKEMMTNPLGEYIAENDNAKQCIGVVGSGNKNFNEQYCLTAKRYAKAFDAPFYDDYELRGNQSDVQRVYQSTLAQFKSL